MHLLVKGIVCFRIDFFDYPTFIFKALTKEEKLIEGVIELS